MCQSPIYIAAFNVYADCLKLLLPIERKLVAEKFRFLVFSKLLVFVLSSIILNGTVSNPLH